jgi:hypothetical protein
MADDTAGALPLPAMPETLDGPHAPRLRQGALITLGSAVILAVSMFVLKWYGVDEIPGRVSAHRPLVHPENAWNGLQVVRWVMLVTIVVAVGTVFLHGSQRAHGAKTNTGALVALLGSITTVLLIDRVLIDMPNANAVVDQKLGAFVGLLSAAGIALGGYESLLEERARSRRAALSTRAARRAAEEESAPPVVTES